MKYYVVTLTQEERIYLTEISNNGKRAAKIVKYALALLSADKGEWQNNHKTNEEIANFLQVTTRTIEHIKKKFVEQGLNDALGITQRLGRIGNNKKFDGEFEAHLIATCCGPAPKGHSGWTLRLLANKMVELNYVESISHESIRRILKKMNLNLGKKMNG